MNRASLPSVLLPERIVLDKIWGGRTLTARLGLAQARVGETWDCFDRGAGSSARIRNLADTTLHDLLESQRDAVLGAADVDAYGRFPLMLKLLDATEWLSLQVHPDDALAVELAAERCAAVDKAGDTGKTEAWVVLDARDDAELVCGFRGSVADLIEAARRHAVDKSMLETLRARRGDVIAIRPGTVHAVGAGYLLYEIQQNSDITLRLYDWGRVGDDGKPREVHLDASARAIERAAESAASVQAKVVVESEGVELLVANSCFELRRIDLRAPRTLDLDGAFALVTPVEGACVVDRTLLGDLETGLVCAARGRVALRPAAGAATMLVATAAVSRPSIV